jgi:uncharacterized protein
MIILIASDIHASFNHLKTALICSEEHVGAVIFNGDIIPKSLFYNVNARQAVIIQRNYIKDVFIPEITSWKESRPDVNIYADFGNDDFWCNRDLMIEAENKGILKLLHNKVQPLTSEVDVVGYMFVPPTPFPIKDAERKDIASEPIGSVLDQKGIFSIHDGLTMRHIDHSESIENDLINLEKRIKSPFILATHAPPYGLGLDILPDGRQVGSMAIRAFIEREADSGRLIAAFSGHVHDSFENSGRFANEVCLRPIVNTGQMDNRLRYALFDLNTKKVVIKTSPLFDVTASGRGKHKNERHA